MDLSFSSPVIDIMTETLANLLQAADAVSGGAGSDPMAGARADMAAPPEALPPTADSANTAFEQRAEAGAGAAAAAPPAEPKTMLETVVGLLADVMTLSKDNVHWVASPAANGDPDDFRDPAMPPMTRTTLPLSFHAAAGPRTPWMVEATPPMTDAVGDTPQTSDTVDEFFTPLTSEAMSGLTPPLIDTPSSGAFRMFTPPVTAGDFSYFTSPLISENLIDFTTPLITPAHTSGWGASSTIPPATEPWDDGYPYTLSHSGNDTVTELLADSLEEWQARALPEPRSDCFLCKYGPIKCEGCCSNDRWSCPDARSVLMSTKDLNYIHDKGYVRQDPAGVRQRRAKVLDWIFQVSSHFSFQRQTAYLAQDFFDRYLMVQGHVDKSSLQLIAATALFIAAKKEEVNPPTVNRFASATNRACEVWEILRSEVKMLKALKWRLSPETPIGWLNSYVHIDAEQSAELSVAPFFNQEVYLQITELLDFCSLDINWLDYSNRELATAAVCHSSSFEVVHRITGLPWAYLYACYCWMIPFKKMLLLNRKPQPRHVEAPSKNAHNIQTYDSKLKLLRESWEGRSLTANGGVIFGTSDILPAPGVSEDLLPEAIGRDLLAALTNDQ